VSVVIARPLDRHYGCVFTLVKRTTAKPNPLQVPLAHAGVRPGARTLLSRPHRTGRETISGVGSKRLRHRRKVAAKRSHRSIRNMVWSPARSDTFPSLGVSSPFPKGLLVFAFFGVGMALVALLALALANHHWF
jgi:hypothetical protein